MGQRQKSRVADTSAGVTLLLFAERGGTTQQLRQQAEGVIEEEAKVKCGTDWSSTGIKNVIALFV